MQLYQLFPISLTKNNKKQLQKIDIPTLSKKQRQENSNFLDGIAIEHKFYIGDFLTLIT